MKELAYKAIDVAIANKARYADIRLVLEQEEEIKTRNGIVEKSFYGEKEGFGIRLLYDNGWGFASSSLVASEEIERKAKEAIEIAKATNYVKEKPISLAPTQVVEANYKTPYQKDPFEVKQDQKIDLLLKCDQAMQEASKKLVSRQASLKFRKIKKIFASSEGSLLEQELVLSGGGLVAIASEDGETQVRSYPKRDGNFASMGYEFVEHLDFVGNAAKVAREAEELLKANPCEAKETTVILYPSQLYLQIHESIGHGIELDRIFGSEQSLAGGSFISQILNKLGSFKYASPCVNVTADATLAGGLGTFGWDDEGIPGQKVDIIKEGMLVGLLTSRETITTLNTLLGRNYSPSGAMRASSYSKIPLIRMTNINLLPGEYELEAMIDEVKDGVILDTNYSWSIDELRKNFSFGTEIGWEIKNGKIRDMIKNPFYTGQTLEFWNSCDAIANKNYFEVYGTLTCGKGLPEQLIHVGHACSPARFRNVRVGSRVR
ncbi:MAG: TldD/PmbA family protein [Candidatus Aenigmarchaeota archaeon]|nr:TldD/PmbA family protein [Candidatus Aenigmarchaeota archaeon]